MNNERLARIRVEAGLSQEAFAEVLDISRGHLAKIETGMFPVSDKVRIRAQAFVDARIADIESGVRDISPPYRKAAAGRTSSSNFRVHIRGLMASIVDDIPEGIYDIFDVDGASMESTLSAGDKVLCRADTIENIQDSKVYVLVTDDPKITEVSKSGIWIKRCSYREKGGYVSCRSDNKDTTEPFSTFRLKVDTIKEVWFPVLKITPHFTDPNRDIYERLDELEGRIEMIEEDLGNT